MRLQGWEASTVSWSVFVIKYVSALTLHITDRWTFWGKHRHSKCLHASKHIIYDDICPGLMYNFWVLKSWILKKRLAAIMMIYSVELNLLCSPWSLHAPVHIPRSAENSVDSDDCCSSSHILLLVLSLCVYRQRTTEFYEIPATGHEIILWSQQ